jgi:copper ion binding protein
MKKTLSITGMSCQHCVRHVTTALSELEGVTNVQVSLENKEAVLDMAETVSLDALKDAVKEVGYTVTDVK